MFDIVISVVASLALTWFFLLRKTREELAALVHSPIKVKKDYEIPSERVAGEYQAVVVRDNYVFVHPRGNADTIDNETYDIRNLQKGMRLSQQQGRKLVTLKRPYHVNKGVKVDKYNKFCTWDGGDAELISTNTDEWTFIYSDSPTDNGDANLMVERKPKIENLWLTGQGQNGIEYGPSYGAVYRRIYGKALDWNIYTRFAMLTLIESCFSTHCVNGWAFGKGNWTGATWSNSQSNSSKRHMNRWFGYSPNGKGFYNEHASGVVDDIGIVEGTIIGSAYELNAPNNTVVKDWSISHGHIECTQGCTDAVVKYDWLGGIITIDKMFSQYATLMVDAHSSAYTQVEVSNIPYWVLKNGKAFYDRTATSWKFRNCDNPLHGDDVLNAIDGRVVKKACEAGSGYDSVCIEPINR